jgi:hypothetical protein
MTKFRYERVELVDLWDWLHDRHLEGCGSIWRPGEPAPILLVQPFRADARLDIETDRDKQTNDEVTNQ